MMRPLEPGVALTLAVLFIAMAVVPSLAVKQFGTAGTYALAVIIGVSGIDPFVLSPVRHGTGGSRAVLG